MLMGGLLPPPGYATDYIGIGAEINLALVSSVLKHFMLIVKPV